MKRKQGISLIVLVITIIVMVILAAAVVITLSNTGIINKANQAVDKTNEKQVQDLAALVWADAFMDGKRGEELKTEVETKLKDYASVYNITVTDTGVAVTKKEQAGGGTNTPPSNVPEDWKVSVREVTEDGVPIPIGFVKSPYENEGTKDGGLVIYALTEDEIKAGKTTITDDHSTALRGRNQFVWVPVPKNEFKAKFIRSNNGMKASDGTTDAYTLSSTIGTSNQYWELVLDENNMPSQNTTTDNIQDYVSPATLLEATKMYESVQKYGGFYIARYEVGSKTVYNRATDGNEDYRATRATTADISNLSVTMQKYPYSTVAWGTSMKDETSSDMAVSLARAFYPSTGTTYGVVSTLTYGVQWDRTLAWWEEQDALDGVDNLNLTNSTSYGVYNGTTIASADLNPGAEYSIYASSKYGKWNSITEKTSTGYWLLTTGGYEKANVYNIYDMAGNIYEWTMEGYSTASRVLRGGSFGNNGGVFPVANRSHLNPASAGINCGFRPSLYIK